MNRGFLYGDGFFETIRVKDGQIPLLDYHCSRIADAMDIFRMEPEFTVNQDFLTDITKPVELRNARVRINFFRDGAGTYLPESNRVGFNIQSAPSDQDFFLPLKLNLQEELHHAPVHKGSIAYYPVSKPINPIFTVKTLSSAYYVLAAIYKQEQKKDYLFLSNDKGIICEELVSNILLVKSGEIQSAPAKSGMLLGATIRYLLATYSFQIEERNWTIDDIESADEIYLCKASTGVMRIR